MKFFILVIAIGLLFSSSKTKEDNDSSKLYGEWKVSAVFCSERTEMFKGFSLAFLKNNVGFLKFKDTEEKEFFIWKTNSDTLKLNFERESEMKNVVFSKDEFLFTVLSYRKKFINLRYLDFKECGVELEFAE